MSVQVLLFIYRCVYIDEIVIKPKGEAVWKGAGTVNSQTKGPYPLKEDAEVFYAILSTLYWDTCNFPKV